MAYGCQFPTEKEPGRPWGVKFSFLWLGSLCGQGEEAQVGWLEGMSAQHQVRANFYSKHVSGVFNSRRKPIAEEGLTCLVARVRKEQRMCT